MTTIEKIKFIAAKTEDDSLLGATVRRILQEDRALEAMEEFDDTQTIMFEDEGAEDMLGGNLADVHMRERFQK